MIIGEDESPCKLVLVLVILTALGYALTPSFSASGQPPTGVPPAERMLGSVAGVEVVAVQGDARSLRIGERAVASNSGERSSSGREPDRFRQCAC